MFNINTKARKIKKKDRLTGTCINTIHDKHQKAIIRKIHSVVHLAIMIKYD